MNFARPMSFLPCTRLVPAIPCVVLILIIPRGFGQHEENPWPREFRNRPAKIALLDSPEGVATAYQTTHFRLLSDDPLSKALLQRFATVIESVPCLLRQLPLPLWAPPGTGKPVIRLCRNEHRFQELGGPPGSAGYYNARKQEILIRADIFLDPPRAKPSRLLPRPDEDLLVHELTHLGMHGIIGKSSPWFYEGLAEYMAAGHRSGGNYSFADLDATIRDHIRKHLPPAEDGTITLPIVALVTGRTGQEWTASNTRSKGQEVYRPYATALLLVHYHLYGKTRRAEVHRYLEKIAAYRDFRKPLPKLRTIPPTEIQNRLQRYWFPRGLNLKFAESDGTDELP